MIPLLAPIILGAPFFFAFPNVTQFILFMVGALIAVVILWFDEFKGYTWYAEPDSPVQLITRSPLFFAAYLPMTIFMVTSSGSALGMGIVLSIGWILLTELLLMRSDISALNARFYVPGTKTLQHREFQAVMAFLAVFLVVMSVLVYL